MFRFDKHCSLALLTGAFLRCRKGNRVHLWRLKTLLRKYPKRVRLEMTESGGPNRRRRIDDVQQLEGDACREAIYFLIHTADEAEVMQNMKETFKHRQELVHNPQRSADVLDVFPRYLDVKGLVNKTFILLCKDCFKYVLDMPAFC